jgi:uncharacterized protein (UPF0212 family)
MTKEQAIKLLRKETSPMEIHLLTIEGLKQSEIMDKIQEAMDMGVEAIEKQIGKKPIVDYVRNSYRKYNCPTCKEEVQINYDITYCLECGQKLDWSEADDSNNI